jgi:hypothetical protein
MRENKPSRFGITLPTDMGWWKKLFKKIRRKKNDYFHHAVEHRTRSD